MNSVIELSPLGPTDFAEQWYEIAVHGHFWVEWRFRAFLEQCRHLRLPLQAPWRGLDIGCGHGLVRNQIERITQWTVDGADLNREALQRNEAGRGKTYLYSIHDRRREFAEHYDFLVLFDVLEHIDDPRAFLESALHHLKPGGWLFVDVPALNSLHSAFDRAVGHLRRYNQRTLRAEARCDSLEMRDIRYWGFSMLPYLALRKLFAARDDHMVIERGLQPPRPWMNRWILAIANLETFVLATPPLGTSLLLAATKVGR